MTLFFFRNFSDSYVPSTVTFGSRLNSFVQVEKIDVVDLSFESDRFLFVSQVLRFSKYELMAWVRLLMLGPSVVLVGSSA